MQTLSVAAMAALILQLATVSGGATYIVSVIKPWLESISAFRPTADNKRMHDLAIQTLVYLVNVGLVMLSAVADHKFAWPSLLTYLMLGFPAFAGSVTLYKTVTRWGGSADTKSVVEPIPASEAPVSAPAPETAGVTI